MNDRNEQEIDLGILIQGIRRNLSWILGFSLLLGLGSYFWSKAQPPVYSASATLISTGSGAQGPDSVLGGATVKASPLPEGALAQAMQSTAVLNPLVQSIKASSIPADEKQRLTQSLAQELASQRLKTISLTSRVEAYSGGSGIYTITAKARQAQTAATLANIATASLLAWDRDRALEGVRRAESGFRAQLAQIDTQLKSMGEDSLERQTLVAKRANVLSSLTQVGILENSASGVLSKLSDAVAPLQPDAPRPLRNAVLATVLGLLLLTGLAALRTLLDRTVRNEDELLSLGIPSLAVIPRLRQRDIVMSGIVRAARQAGLYEAVGFLRVNLLASLPKVVHPIIMVTSTAPGEGKSSLTAALADGLAASGQRVLIVDADLRRGTQEAVWKKFSESGDWQQLVGQGGAHTTREALLNPENVQVLRVETNVDMLPAGQSLHDSLSVFNQANIERAFSLWREQYDVVLIDSAPLLALADGLVIGKHADGVLMVTEFGRTNVQAVRSALRRAERGDLKLLGAVINKADVRENESYSYSYSPRSTEIRSRNV